MVGLKAPGGMEGIKECQAEEAGSGNNRRTGSKDLPFKRSKGFSRVII